MKTYCPIRLLLFTCLILGITLALPGPADARWYWIHGHSGHVQDESLIYGPSRFGWGLDFYHRHGVNWVHFTLPTQGNKGVRSIRLKFETSGNNAHVQRIDLYDGNIKFMEIPGSRWGAHDIELDLGRRWTLYRGLGISIGIFGSEIEGTPWFNFISVGANIQ